MAPMSAIQLRDAYSVVAAENVFMIVFFVVIYLGFTRWAAKARS